MKALIPFALTLCSLFLLAGNCQPPAPPSLNCAEQATPAVCANQAGCLSVGTADAFVCVEKPANCQGHSGLKDKKGTSQARALCPAANCLAVGSDEALICADKPKTCQGYTALEDAAGVKQVGLLCPEDLGTCMFNDARFTCDTPASACTASQKHFFGICIPIAPVPTFEPYIDAVLEQVHEEHSITDDARAQLSSILLWMANSISVEAKKKLPETIKPSHVQDAIRVVFTVDLAKHATSEAAKAVDKYHQDKDLTKTEAQRAGLQFDVDTVRKIMTVKGAVTDDPETAVALAAALEYMSAEISELAGNLVKDTTKQIVVDNLETAIADDDELKQTMQNVAELSG